MLLRSDLIYDTVFSRIVVSQGAMFEKILKRKHCLDQNPNVCYNYINRKRKGEFIYMDDGDYDANPKCFFHKISFYCRN